MRSRFLRRKLLLTAASLGTMRPQAWPGSGLIRASRLRLRPRTERWRRLSSPPWLAGRPAPLGRIRRWRPGRGAGAGREQEEEEEEEDRRLVSGRGKGQAKEEGRVGGEQVGEAPQGPRAPLCSTLQPGDAARAPKGGRRAGERKTWREERGTGPGRAGGRRGAGQPSPAQPSPAARGNQEHSDPPAQPGGGGGAAGQ